MFLLQVDRLPGGLFQSNPHQSHQAHDDARLGASEELVPGEAGEAGAGGLPSGTVSRGDAAILACAGISPLEGGGYMLRFRKAKTDAVTGFLGSQTEFTGKLSFAGVVRISNRSACHGRSFHGEGTRVHLDGLQQP